MHCDYIQYLEVVHLGAFLICKSMKILASCISHRESFKFYGNACDLVMIDIPNATHIEVWKV